MAAQVNASSNAFAGRPVRPIINFNHHIKPQNNRSSYSSNTVVGTLAVDGWAVIFGTARRGLGGAAACPVPSLLVYQLRIIRCGL